MSEKRGVNFLKSIGGRSIVSISILIILISMILTLFFTNSQKTTLERELINRVNSLANNFAYNSPYWVLTNHRVGMLQLIDGVMKEEEIVYAFIVDAQGNRIGRIDSTRIVSANKLDLSLNINAALPEMRKKYIEYTGLLINEVIRPIEIKNEKKEEYEAILFDEERAPGAEQMRQDSVPASDVRRLGVAYIGVSMEKLNRSIELVQRQAFMLTFGIIMLGIVFTIVMTNFITTPIRKLMEATKRLAHGDLDHVVPVARNDEIGILAHSFNQMTGELKKSREKIENWNKELEAKVIERTSELSEKNVELKQYSEELKRAYEELQTLDKAKDDFLALVSHELRTPLSSIVAYTEVLLDGMADTEEEEQSYLEIIKNESDRLTRLINNVLDISKMEAGRMPFLFSPVPINMVVNNSVDGLAGVAKKHNHIIHNCLAESTCLIKADEDKIVQVLSNILSNAIKFTPDGGEIKICGRPLHNQFEFAISDTGIGIKPEDQNKVFDKFQQIEDVDHHSEGTGLGMPISRLIIENHNGNLWLESDVGKGTTFYFTVPLYQNGKE